VSTEGYEDEPSVILNKAMQRSLNQPDPKGTKSSRREYGSRRVRSQKPSTVDQAEGQESYNADRIVGNRVTSSSTKEGHFVTTPPTAHPSDQRASALNARSRLSRPTISPANLAKRKRSSPRPDTYDIPSDESEAEVADVMGVTIEESPRNRAKRPRKNARAELPPEQNRLQDIRKLRSQQSPKRSVSIREPADAGSVRGSQIPSINSNLPSRAGALTSNGKVKSKRGRPRKNVPKPTSFNENTVGMVLSSERDDNTVPSPGLDSRSQAFGEVDIEHNVLLASPVETGDRLGRTLRSPTPAHLGIENQEPPSSIKKHSKMSISAHSVNDHPEPSVSQTQDPSNNLNVEFSDLEPFDIMLAKLKHGRHEMEENTNKQSSNNAGKKSEGGVLKESLVSLTMAYIALRTARMASRPRVALNAQKKVELSTKDVIAKANGLNLNSRESLSNVYLDLLPSLINAVRAGTDAHTVEEDISDISLQEIANLLDSIYNLATRAVEQPTRLQPKAIRGTSSVRQPTIEVLPMIREVRKRFLAELRSRQQAQELADREELAAERVRRQQDIAKEQLEFDAAEKNREQEENKARLERQILANELHRLQRKALDARLADPLRAQWVKSEMATDEAKVEVRRRGTIPKTRTSAPARVTSALTAWTSEELVEHDVLASDCERVVGVFGKSKKRREPSPRPWPSKARTIFIDTMRFERGSTALMNCYDRLRTNIT
jgi:hypothetical protein